MKLIRYDYPTLNTWNEVDSFFDEAFNNFWRRGMGQNMARWNPAADLYEDDENVYLRLEVPGMKKDQIHIEVENQVLTVSAESRREGEKEQTVQNFSRSFSVPDGVDLEKIKARLEDGLLTLTMPKAEKRKPRAIEIR